MSFLTGLKYQFLFFQACVAFVLNPVLCVQNAVYVSSVVVLALLL